CAGVEKSGGTPRWSEKESDPLVSTRISSEPGVEMGDYLSVIRRRKLLIAAMTLAGLALALFYSVAVAKPSYVSHAKVLVRPITADVTPGPRQADRDGDGARDRHVDQCGQHRQGPDEVERAGHHHPAEGAGRGR